MDDLIKLALILAPVFVILLFTMYAKGGKSMALGFIPIFIAAAAVGVLFSKWMIFVSELF